MDAGVWAAWASASIASLLAIITWRYVRLTHDISKATERSAAAAERSAAAAERSVTAAEQSAKIAQQSAEAARQSVAINQEELREQRTQRLEASQPLVVPSFSTRSYKSDEPWEFSILLTNVGNGPALYVSVNAFVGHRVVMKVLDGMKESWFLPVGQASRETIFRIARDQLPVPDPDGSDYDWLVVKYKDVNGRLFNLIAPVRLDTNSRQISMLAPPRVGIIPEGESINTFGRPRWELPF